jgi:hypothetical protein
LPPVLDRSASSPVRGQLHPGPAGAGGATVRLLMPGTVTYYWYRQPHLETDRLNRLLSVKIQNPTLHHVRQQERRGRWPAVGYNYGRLGHAAVYNPRAAHRAPNRTGMRIAPLTLFDVFSRYFDFHAMYSATCLGGHQPANVAP